MPLKDLKAELSSEVSTILGPDFSVEITSTTTVPYANDGKITFPNLDAKKFGCKLIETCVLYIDMRRSTELNLRLKPQTVAKLYSAFVRTMTRCARYFGGHVRGIIGDRVMVLFDKENAFQAAMDCAVLMHSAGKYILNKHFKSTEVTFGVGIDAGRMLATKTGIRKNGNDQQNYRNLVWLGRPANVASKLTDLANKPAEVVRRDRVRVAYGYPPNNTKTWIWLNHSPVDFADALNTVYGAQPLLKHDDPAYAAHYTTHDSVTVRAATPPILMTEAVWNGFKAANPNSDIVKKGWIKKVDAKVPGYTGAIYGGDVIKTDFKD